MNKIKIADWTELEALVPTHALVVNVDLVIVRYGDDVSVMYGRCLHRGALLADGSIDGQNLICGVHGWDYRYNTGVSEYNNAERLQKFSSWVEDGALLVDEDEIAAWARDHPQPYHRDAYQGGYADFHGTIEEPFTKYIHDLARNGLSRTGMHGPTAAMGVPRQELPTWDDIQFVTIG